MCKNFKRVFLVFAVLVGVSVRAQANPEPTSDTIEERKDSSKTEQFILHYRVNEIERDADYMDNKTATQNPSLFCKFSAH